MTLTGDPDPSSIFNGSAIIIEPFDGIKFDNSIIFPLPEEDIL